jgi:hypothetical protein
MFLLVILALGAGGVIVAIGLSLLEYAAAIGGVLMISGGAVALVGWISTGGGAPIAWGLVLAVVGFLVYLAG